MSSLGEIETGNNGSYRSASSPASTVPLLAGIDGDARHAREAISIKSEAETSDAIQPGAGGRLIVLL